MSEKCCCDTSESLAMASVPMQMWSELYDWETALQEGTIFPELNMPAFFAENNIGKTGSSSLSLNPEQQEREKLMSEISCIGFAINDLTLYLDTHPDCPNGTPLFYELSEKRMELLADYARKYNPLTQLSMVTGRLNENCFGWAEGPMPWEGGCI